jgi:hypothetical protein
MQAIDARRLIVVAGFIAAALWFTSAPVAASPTMPTSAMMAPIKAIAAAINANDLAVLKKFYTSSPVIIDEYAPYRWSGPNAVPTWFAVFGAFLTTAKITEGHVTLADPSYFDATNDRAEIIMPATFSFLIAGKPGADSGLWTFVLVKSGSSWKAESSAWARTQLTM